jgi:hypothetical protein
MYSLSRLSLNYIFVVYFDKQHNSEGYVEPKQPTRAVKMEWCCEESWIGVACYGFSVMLEKRYPFFSTIN